MSEETSAGKSPINLLQELCIKKDVTPVYEVINSDGPTHQPTFCFKVTAGNVTALGKGSSKKAAKHDAAQKAVSAILAGSTITPAFASPSRAYMVDLDSQPVQSLPRNDNSSSPVMHCSPGDLPLGALPDDGFGPNPVGELQEYAQKRALAPPEYEYPPETGPPHARTFACLVTFAGKQEKGSGKTKKDAKREAAGRMMQLLRRARPHGRASNSFQSADEASINSDDGGGVIPLGEDEEPLRYDVIKSKSILTLTTDGSQAAADFFENLRNDPGISLLGLQQQHSLSSSNVNYIEKLREISVEKRFNIVYVDIEEISKSGQRQCLVQLSTQPVAVCFGTGLTIENARQEAAYNSLQYLKIMTSKD